MRIQNRIKEGQKVGNDMHFILEANESHFIGTPAQKMITDSDETAFVYLMDADEGYAYIHFPRETWSSMLQALDGGADPYLVWKDESIPLKGFIEELTLLLYNIEGNDNYGEAFTTAVEQEFEAFLQRVN